jgi:uncharacterized membrane protein
MTDAHLHLLVNHLPIVGVLLGSIILMAGMLLKQPIVRMTAYALLILCSILTLPAFFTGEGAEEMIEHLPGVSHDLIHAHEEAAETALWLSEILGIFAVIALYFEQTRHKLAGIFSILTLVLNLGTFASMSYTGNTGGEIRHPEIRNGYSTVPTETAGEEEHD